MEVPKGLIPKNKDEEHNLLEDPKPKRVEESVVEEPKIKTESQNTKVYVDFSKLVKDGRYRNREEMRYEGARIFRKKFKVGLFRNKLKSKPEVLEIIVSLGLAKDKNSAKRVIESLVGKWISYSSYEQFKLEEVENSYGNKAYRLDGD